MIAVCCSWAGVFRLECIIGSLRYHHRALHLPVHIVLARKGCMLQFCFSMSLSDIVGVGLCGWIKGALVPHWAYPVLSGEGG